VNSFKKCLVFTHTAVPNYGANLQALATNLLLRESGYEPTYLSIIPGEVEKHYSRSVDENQRSIHTSFVKKNIILTETFNSKTEVEEYVSKSNYELLVTGSDAVFKLDNSSEIWDLNYPNPFWLDAFLGDKISISASAMGSDIWKCIEKTNRDRFTRNLSNFKTLTVRDSWTARQLSKFGLNPKVTLDPVFFLPHLNKSYDYREYLDEKYVVTSIPKHFSSEWKLNLKDELNSLGYEAVEIGTPESSNSYLDPYEWYSLIAKSAGFIGMRFHPIVVSLANGVPVFALDQYARTPWHRAPSKTYQLLEQFNLSKNHCTKLGYRFIKPRDIVKKLFSQDEKTLKLVNKIVATQISYFREELKNCVQK
jgi:hypothetical protein